MSRSAGDRLLLGVCAAVARHANVGVTIVRVIAAVGLAILTPLFFVAYATLAFVVPRDDGRWLGGDFRDRREALIGWTLAIAAPGLVIASPSLFAPSAFSVGDDISLLDTGMLAIAIGLVALILALWEQRRRTVSEAPSAVAAAGEIEHAATTEHHGITSETEELEPEPVRRASIFVPAFGAIIAALGLGAIVIAVGDIALSAVAGAVIAGTVAVGCGAVAIAANGRRGVTPLLVLGVLFGLVAATAAVGRAEIDRGVGTERLHALDAADIRAGHRWGIGYLVVDVRGVKLPRGRTVMPVDIGFGRVRVIAPVDLEIVSIGEAVDIPEPYGRRRRNDPVLAIDADVRVGSIEVDRMEGG